MSIATHRNIAIIFHFLNPLVSQVMVDALRTPSTSAPETGRPTPHIAYNAPHATADHTV